MRQRPGEGKESLPRMKITRSITTRMMNGTSTKTRLKRPSPSVAMTAWKIFLHDRVILSLFDKVHYLDFPGNIIRRS